MTSPIVSATQLTATILTSDIDNAGTQRITVIDPGSGGGKSSAIAISVTRPRRR